MTRTFYPFRGTFNGFKHPVTVTTYTRTAIIKRHCFPSLACQIRSSPKFPLNGTQCCKALTLGTPTLKKERKKSTYQGLNRTDLSLD